MVVAICIIVISLTAASLIYFLTGMYSMGWPNFGWLYILAYIGMIIGFLLLSCISYVGYLGIVSLIKNKKNYKKPSKYIYWLLQQTSFFLPGLCNFHIKADLTGMPTDKRYLYICNHTSAFDPLLSIKISKNNPLICISKPENFDIPIFGNLMLHSGFISINRDDDRESVKAILDAIKVIKKDQGSIFVCPEGTRSKTGELLDFHAGTFKIAYKAQAPIVVVVFKNVWNVMKNMPFKKTHVEIKVVKVFEYEEYKDINTQELATICRNLMLEELKK